MKQSIEGWVIGGWMTVVAVSGASGSSTQQPGVYTDAQARRGQRAYEQSCAACHRLDLLGDTTEEIPPLADMAFMEQWGSQPLGKLFEYMRTNMPGNKPRSLTAREYADILAYILEVNKLPAGSQELQADGAALQLFSVAGETRHTP